MSVVLFGVGFRWHKKIMSNDKEGYFANVHGQETPILLFFYKRNSLPLFQARFQVCIEHRIKKRDLK